MKTHSYVRLFLAVLLTVNSSLLFAQTGLATLTGVVTDPTNAVVAGSTIRATHIETGTVLTAVSSAAGNYAITQMPIGRYTVTTEAAGFKTYQDRKSVV